MSALGRIRKYADSRRAGFFTEAIRQVQTAVAAVREWRKTCDTPELACYEEALGGIIRYYRANRFLPGSLLARIGVGSVLSSPLGKLFITTLAADDETTEVKIKDLVLRFPKHCRSHNFYIGLLDNLLAYLLNIPEGMQAPPAIYRYGSNAYVEGPYEYGPVFVKPDDIVIDAGAHLGEFSAMAAAKGATAYAFEPAQPLIERHLAFVARRNPRVTVCPYALSDRCGMEGFYYDEAAAEQSRLSATDEGAQILPSEQVETITLDAYVERFHVPWVDFIKADIEGAERNLLAGAQRVLKEFAPRISICTYHLPDDPEVLRDLILGANPRYTIEEHFKKMYAYVKE